MDFKPRIATYLAVTFGYSWACWLPAAWLAWQGNADPVAHPFWWSLAGFGAWGPLLGAVTVAWARDGRNGVRELLNRLLRVRFGARWYLVALGLFPLLVGGSLALAVLAGAERPELPALAQPAALPIAFVVILLLGGPLQEELGWRGTLQDALQQRWPALWSSLLVGLIWGLWHLPLFLMPREESYYNRPVWGLVITTMLISVPFTWLYNRTDRSLFAVLLLHASFNWSHYVFPALSSDRAGLILFGLQLAVIVALVASRSLRFDRA
jgi:membrane protease YdiL (CAAX protease family)